MTYRNGVPPQNPEALAEFLLTELGNIAQAVNSVPKYSAEAFKDKRSSANTRDKSEGRPLWDSTTKKPVWPQGNAPESSWIFGDGSLAYSPS